MQKWNPWYPREDHGSRQKIMWLERSSTHTNVCTTSAHNASFLLSVPHPAMPLWHSENNTLTVVKEGSWQGVLSLPSLVLQVYRMPWATRSSDFLTDLISWNYKIEVNSGLRPATQVMDLRWAEVPLLAKTCEDARYCTSMEQDVMYPQAWRAFPDPTAERTPWTDSKSHALHRQIQQLTL